MLKNALYRLNRFFWHLYWRTFIRPRIPKLYRLQSVHAPDTFGWRVVDNADGWQGILWDDGALEYSPPHNMPPIRVV